MPIRPCPVCGQQTPKYVHAGLTDEYTVVTYYHCPGCAHVWSVDKREPAKVTHVTPLPHKKRPA